MIKAKSVDADTSESYRALRYRSLADLYTGSFTGIAEGTVFLIGIFGS